MTAQAGIRFTHNSGRAGRKYLPETLGSGCAFFDLDGDGWPDILMVNSKDWTPRGRKSLADLLVGVTGDFVPAREVLRLGYLARLFVAPIPGENAWP